MKPHPLIARANDKDVKQVGGFATAAANIDVDELCGWYKDEIDAAPLRTANGGKRYLVNHTGMQKREHFGDRSESRGEGRKEEHLATALFNDYGHASQGLIIDEITNMRVLDYQLPLKAKSGDALIGKVDLLALTSEDQLMVVELKYMPVAATVSKADTPLRAFLEGLAYCAFLEAELDAIRQEAEEKYEQRISKSPPGLIVIANENYWKLFNVYQGKPSWTEAMERLAAGVQDKLNIPVFFLSLVITDDPIKYEDLRPKFKVPPVIKRAW